MKTVLIVEDSELNIDLLTQLLEDHYALLVARDGAAGVALAEQQVPDLVIMDIALPVMDGYEATRRIREEETAANDASHVPIVALTANAIQGDRERCIAAGMDDYLAKPFRKEDLHAVVARWLP